MDQMKLPEYRSFVDSLIFLLADHAGIVRRQGGQETTWQDRDQFDRSSIGGPGKGCGNIGKQIVTRAGKAREAGTELGKYHLYVVERVALCATTPRSRNDRCN